MRDAEQRATKERENMIAAAAVASGDEDKAKNRRKKQPAKRSFFSRFVEGYLASSTEDMTEKKERMTIAISDFFGSQKNTTDLTVTSDGSNP